MRRKLIALVFVVLMVLGLLPSVAFADPDPGVYNANDVEKIQAFLVQPSAEAGKSNAEQLGYDVGDPSTWLGIWDDGSTGDYRVKQITNGNWDSKSLAGTLDLTGCDELYVLWITDNAINSLDVSNLNKLTNIYCEQNNLTSISLSGCENLYEIKCDDNLLTALDLSALSELGQLTCKNNKLTMLDLTDNAALAKIDCSNNKLSALHLSAQTNLWELHCANNTITSLSVKSLGLERLYCENNKITSLDLTAVTDLRKLNCKNNALTTLDLSKFDGLRELDVTGNKLSMFKAVIEDKNIEIKTDGAGYVGLAYKETIMGYASVDDGMTPMKSIPEPGFFYAEAVPAAPSTFVRWMDADAKEVSKTAKIDLTPGQSYALTAKFLPPLTIDSSEPSGKIYTSGRITLTPSIPGGTWTWDETFFTATFNSPATFTPLKTGTSRVTYTVEGTSTHYDITALPPLQISSSVSGGKIYTNGRITLTANIPGGTWTWDQALLSAVINGDSATFTAKEPGTSRVTYTVEGMNAHYDITAIVADLPATGQDYTWFYILGGLAAGALILADLLHRRNARV